MIYLILKLIFMRRFSFLPSKVWLLAIGFSGPIPTVSIFVAGTPLSTRYFFITSASFWKGFCCMWDVPKNRWKQPLHKICWLHDIFLKLKHLPILWGIGAARQYFGFWFYVKWMGVVSEDISAKNLKDKNIVKKYIVGCLDHLVALIDNGGRRSWL